MLARLVLRALRAVDEQDGAVHLRGARDHVLHVVGVTRAVDVRVVARRRLVLDVREVDRDAARALLGRAVDLVEAEAASAVLGRHHLGERGREGGLAVVDVTDGSDVDMHLAHGFLLWFGLLGSAPPRSRTSISRLEGGRPHPLDRAERSGAERSRGERWSRSRCPGEHRSVSNRRRTLSGSLSERKAEVSNPTRRSARTAFEAGLDPVQLTFRGLPRKSARGCACYG